MTKSASVEKAQALKIMSVLEKNADKGSKKTVKGRAAVRTLKPEEKMAVKIRDRKLKKKGLKR